MADARVLRAKYTKYMLLANKIGFLKSMSKEDSRKNKSNILYKKQLNPMRHFSYVFVLYAMLIFSLLALNAIAQVGVVNPGPGNYIVDCAGTYTPCTANDVEVDPESYSVVNADGTPLYCGECNETDYSNAYLQVKYRATANERYNVFLLFYIGSTQYRVCLDDLVPAGADWKTVRFPIAWKCDESLILTGPIGSTCTGPILTWSNNKDDATWYENQDLDPKTNTYITDCHGGSKCFCYPAKTVPTPCTAVAKDFAICEGTTVDPNLFISKDVECNGGCNLELDYDLVNSSQPTEDTEDGLPYPYTVTCTGSLCGSDPTAIGYVTVIAKPDCTITSMNPCELTAGNTAQVPDAGLGATYQWSITGDGVLNPLNQNDRIVTWDSLEFSSGIATISVTVTGPEPYRCFCSSTKTVRVFDTPIAGIEEISIVAS